MSPSCAFSMAAARVPSPGLTVTSAACDACVARPRPRVGSPLPRGVGALFSRRLRETRESREVPSRYPRYVGFPDTSVCYEVIITHPPLPGIISDRDWQARTGEGSDESQTPLHPPSLDSLSKGCLRTAGTEHSRLSWHGARERGVVVAIERGVVVTVAAGVHRRVAREAAERNRRGHLDVQVPLRARGGGLARVQVLSEDESRDCDRPSWNVFWTDPPSATSASAPAAPAEAEPLRTWRRVQQGVRQACSRVSRSFPLEYRFYPRSWQLPKEARRYASSCSRSTSRRPHGDPGGCRASTSPSATRR